MRTTVTLEPDVETMVKTVMRERGLTFKEAVNHAIRAGLRAPAAGRFRQRTATMGFRPDISYDKALQIAAAVEDHEVLRKLAVGT
ncbi:MAG TPA: antitoxin [Candidatus Dormibacteraeota bacterium]|nr:antitoxin [Candidatus Dormibacteraeota bacterium]